MDKVKRILVIQAPVSALALSFLTRCHPIFSKIHILFSTCSLNEMETGEKKCFSKMAVSFQRKISLAIEINSHTFTKTNLVGLNIKPNPLNL